MDRRVRKTQQSLIEVFLELLEEKGFDRITINEVADRADVNRSTVYAHYADKYDLFKKCIEMHLEKIFIGCSNASPEDLLLNTFSYIKQNKAVFQLFLKENYTGLFHMVLLENIRNQSVYNLSTDDILKKEIQQQFLISATAGIFEWYILNADKYSIADVINRYKDMVLEYNIVSRDYI